MANPATSSSNQNNVEHTRGARDASRMLSLRTIAVAVGLSFVPAAAQAQRTCKTGGLFAGSPTFKTKGDEKLAAAGMGLTDEPPLQWRTLDFSGKTLFTNTGQELWAADLAAG